MRILTEQIKVQKYNEVYLHVTAEQGIEQELSDYFAYYVDGYKHMPKYKMGVWDGRLKLYSLARKTLFVGLYENLKKFTENNGYEIIENNIIDETNNLDKKEVFDWLIALEHTARGESVEVYEHQHDAVYAALNENRITLESPTSSGKSLMIYSIIRWHLEHDRKILLIVPTTQLVEQIYSDFEDYSSMSNWNTSDYCQKLYSGQSKDVTLPVLISTWQSLHAAKKNTKAKLDIDLRKFDVVLCDEVHLAAAASISGILESMVDTKYRVGLTGTLNDSKANRLQICGLFGRPLKVITTRELMDQGKVVDLDIRCLIIDHCEEDRKLVRKAKYEDELDFIIKLPRRNEFIANLAVATKGNTLVLVTWIDTHLLPLAELIKIKAGDRPVYLIHGDVKPKEREAIRLQLENETNAIVVASSATTSTGTNIPSIENIIMGSAGKSKIRNLQSIGRGLRLKTGKTKCKLFDIVDDMSIKKHDNHLLRHAKERFDIYAKEQFNFKLVNVKI